MVCHLVSWVAGALLPAAGMAGRLHPLCVWLTIAKEGRSWDASCGMQVVVRFGLDLSAILCMETNPNQPLLACLVSFVLLPL